MPEKIKKNLIGECARQAAQAQHALLAIVAVLLAVGIVMIYSASAPRSIEFSDSTYRLRRQILWALLSVIGMALAWGTDYRQIAGKSKWVIGIAAALLFFVLIPGIGHQVGGARRWFRFSIISFQPSEFAKLAVVLFAAAYASARGDKLREFRRGFLPAFGLVCLIAFLVLLEPDFGTAVFIGTVGVVVLIVGGIRLLHLLPFAGAAGVGALGILLLAPQKFAHVWGRIAVWWDPSRDPLGGAHQLNQSLIALGSGGSFGMGLGQSMQKLFFLPEQHTDYIFAILGEEVGFLGAAAVVVLFMLFVWQGIRIASCARDRLGFLLAFGIVFQIGLQAAMNIAVSAVRAFSF
ncbi:MAG: FtsW/RodA/SpoVE family cell cycle protein [Planctomycetota bacterium]|jgi:cell division protein FtsW